MTRAYGMSPVQITFNESSEVQTGLGVSTNGFYQTYSLRIAVTVCK